jgi:hypothetical protein
MRASNILGLAVCVSLLLAVPALAGGYRAPRDAYGHPDLGGIWTSTSLTELERPASLKTLTISDEEAAVFEKRRAKEFASVEDGVGGRASELDFWAPASKLARIDGKARTSWIVDPADGRLPYTAAGLAAVRRMPAAINDAANPETRNPSERCLLVGFGGAGPPMLNGPYASEYEFVQTRDAVAIHLESVHDVRIVRTNVATHLPPGVRPWLGDSIGRWEGETLVVETTNFNPGDAFKAPLGVYIAPDAKVTERFTRIAPSRMLYEFSVEEPKTFSQVWRAQMVFETTKGPIYEYACHEGNYALPGILAGARREEADARAAGK